MTKPGKRPKPMAQVIAEKQRNAEQNAQKRAQRIENLANGLDQPNAMYLLQDRRQLSQFAQDHNVKPQELPTLKELLEKKARQ